MKISVGMGERESFFSLTFTLVSPRTRGERIVRSRLDVLTESETHLTVWPFPFHQEKEKEGASDPWATCQREENHSSKKSDTPL